MSDVYAQALAKHQWAQQHIGKLEVALREWREKDPCSIDIKENAATGDVTYYVSHVPVIPVEVPLIAGDVLNNLRSALDFMACGLVGADNITSKTKFPIRRDPKDWEVSGLRMVDGASKDAIEALRRIRPYEGGNTLLYILHTLNNIDKHRLLLTVNLKNTGRASTEAQHVLEEELDEVGAFRHSSGVLVSVRQASGISKVPLYAGQELLTVPAAQRDQNVGFMVEVAFGESGQAKGMPVVFTLQMVARVTGKTIADLERFV